MQENNISVAFLVLGSSLPCLAAAPEGWSTCAPREESLWLNDGTIPLV
jgi:hypothetical protein